MQKKKKQQEKLPTAGVVCVRWKFPQPVCTLVFFTLLKLLRTTSTAASKYKSTWPLSFFCFMTCFRSGNTGSEKIRQRWLAARSLSLNQQQSRRIQSSTSAFCNEEQSAADNGFIYPNLLFLSASRSRAGIHPHAHLCTSWFCLWTHAVSTHINKHKFKKKRKERSRCVPNHTLPSVYFSAVHFLHGVSISTGQRSPKPRAAVFAGTGSGGG